MESVTDDLRKIAQQNMDYATSRRKARQAFIDTQKNLDHCLFKMSPKGVKTEESYEFNSRGIEIFTKRWLPEDVPMKGVICFCHGYGDTCTFFFDGIATRIAASGYGIFALDYPGFGLSEGLHGYIPSFEELVEDVIEEFLKVDERPDVKGLPRFVFGQSMGGAVALNVHLKMPSKWDGAILVAPMCKIKKEILPPWQVLKVLEVLSKLCPKQKLFPQPDMMEVGYRDATKGKLAGFNVVAYNDRLRLKTAMEMLRTTEEIERQMKNVTCSLLILHGESDKLTDPGGSRDLYTHSSSNDKTLKIYEEGHHTILEGEPDERIFEVFDDIISWLDERCRRLSINSSQFTSAEEKTVGV